jgi:hypothetical protein
MLKKRIAYVDYNGASREEDFYFNLTKAELMELELGGGLSENLKRIVESEDMEAIVRNFKEVILSAYGQKSEDGKRFMKSDALREAFYENPAYSELFIELASNPDSAVEFIKGILPSDLANEVNIIEKQSVETVELPQEPTPVLTEKELALLSHEELLRLAAIGRDQTR